MKKDKTGDSKSRGPVLSRKKRVLDMAEDNIQLLEEFLQYRASSKYRNINGMRKQIKKLFLYLQEMDIELSELKVKWKEARQTDSHMPPAVFRTLSRELWLFMNSLK